MSDAPSPLAPRDIAQLFRATTTTLAAELAALSPQVLGWHPAPGEWCVSDAGRSDTGCA